MPFKLLFKPTHQLQPMGLHYLIETVIILTQGFLPVFSSPKRVFRAEKSDSSYWVLLIRWIAKSKQLKFT